MTSLTTTAATAVALTLMLGAGMTASSHSAQAQQRMQQGQQGMGMQPGQRPGMMGQGAGPGLPMQPGEVPAMMGQGGRWHMGPHMMSPDEMWEMMAPMGGMPGQGMGPGMMGQGMGPGMMGEGMGGWSGLAGRRVVPMVLLSTADVRGFLERHLAALGNQRLKVGKVEAVDDDTIAADIVTVDDSLVESFAVDRHSGLISPAG